MTSVISTSIDLYASDLVNYTFPVTINGGTAENPTVVRGMEPITLTSSQQYFIIGSEYVTLDGMNNPVDVTEVTDWKGIVQNGTTGANGFSNVTIKNVIVNGEGLASRGGYIAQLYFSKDALNNLIENCSSTGIINGIRAGGICGDYAGSSSGSLIINKSYSTGEQTGPYTGGICGPYAARYGGSVTLNNVFSTGTIGGTESGGLIGYVLSSQSGDTMIINNSYTTGDISVETAGGLVGRNSPAIINNSYTSGAVIDDNNVIGPNFVGTVTDVYTALGSWTNVDARANLNSSTLPEPYEGTVWRFEGEDTPYTLVDNQPIRILNPSLTNFTIPTKEIIDDPFTITPPTSDSGGWFSYTSSDPSVATVSGDVITIVSGGETTITATQAAIGDYNEASITTTFTVLRTPSLTNFTIPTKEIIDDPFTITPPTSDSGGAFTYTSSDPSVATVFEDVITIVSGGETTITATQAAFGYYTEGITTAVFVINKLESTLTYPPFTFAYGSDPVTLPEPTSNSSGIFTYISSNESVATVSGDVMTIVAIGETTITATQAADEIYLENSITTLCTISSQSSDNPLIITESDSLENILNTATEPIYVVFNTESIEIDELISYEKLQMKTENHIRLIKPTIG